MNRKVLVPLATLLAAGSIAVGSGATFSSTTGNTISAVIAGTLTQSNSKDGQAIRAPPHGSGLCQEELRRHSARARGHGGLPCRFMGDLYSSMIVGWPTAVVFPDEGTGDAWEPREGPLGSVDVWLHHPDGASARHATVMGASLHSVTGVRITDDTAAQRVSP